MYSKYRPNPIVALNLPGCGISSISTLAHVIAFISGRNIAKLMRFRNNTELSVALVTQVGGFLWDQRAMVRLFPLDLTGAESRNQIRTALSFSYTAEMQPRLTCSNAGYGTFANIHKERKFVIFEYIVKSPNKTSLLKRNRLHFFNLYCLFTDTCVHTTIAKHALVWKEKLRFKTPLSCDHILVELPLYDVPFTQYNVI